MRDPVTRESMRDLLRALQGQAVRKLAPLVKDR